MVKVADVAREPRAKVYPNTPLVHARALFRSTEERIIPIVKSEKEDKYIGFLTRVEAIIPTSTKSRLRVRDVARDYPTLRPDMNLDEAVEMLEEFKAYEAPVVDENGNLVGVFTLRDAIQALRSLGYEPKAETVSEIMTTEDLDDYVVTPDTPINKVWSKFVFKGLPAVIVVRSKEDRTPIGIITPFDLIRKGRWRFHREIRAGKITTPAKVRRIMTRGIVVADVRSLVEDVATVMVENDFTVVPVVDEEGKLAGIVTMADVVKAYLKGRKPGRVPVKPIEKPIPAAEEKVTYRTDRELLQEVVVKAEKAYVVSGLTAKDIARLHMPAITINDTVEHARKEMLRRKTNYLLVVDEAGRIVGVISKFDMLKAIAFKGPIWRRRVYDKFFIDFIMNKNIPKVKADDPIEKVALQLLSSGSEVATVEDEEGNLIGFITKDDLVDAYTRTQTGRILVENLIMPGRVSVVHPHHSLAHAVRRMLTFHLDALTVYDGSRILGVVSANRLPFVAFEDALRASKSRRLVWVRRLMRGGRKLARYVVIAPLLVIHATTPLQRYVSPKDDAFKAIEIMKESNVDGVPVVDEDGRVIGTITKNDILREMARYAEVAVETAKRITKKGA
ncbi:CBS domain-containing protein [Stetteria hydrogenophila]